MASNYVVQTEYGKVRGHLHTSLVDVPYIRFLGIPYATPPTGNLRFKAPLKLESWGEDILDANQEKSPCAARNSKTKQVVGSEDCLYLNIFTKNLSPTKPHAVMVYIFGGGHCFGSNSLNSYSPDYILLADVVVVTLNFRIGPLGFLSLQDKSLNVPGNAGLKDQQLAMKFIKKNIQNFGGDPNNCTLFGHSSGAHCVSLHCIAESSRELFDKAIVMSGSPFAKVDSTSDKNYAFELGKKLGFDGHNESDLLAFLEKANVLSMAEAQLTLIESNGKKFGMLPFGPCIEPYDNDSSFMLKLPIDLLKSAWSNDIDLVIGGTSGEGIDNESVFENDPNYESMIPTDIKLKIDDEKLKNFATRAKDLYRSLSSSEIEAYQKFNGDQLLWIAMQRFINLRQNCNAKGSTFLYRFAVDSPTQNHYRNRIFGIDKGVVHADELSYLWKCDQGDVPSRDSIEFISILRFTCLLTSFAVNGDPNTNVLHLDSFDRSMVWKPVESPPYKGLNIDETLEFKTTEESERLQLLERLCKELSIPLSFR